MNTRHEQDKMQLYRVCLFRSLRTEQLSSHWTDCDEIVYWRFLLNDFGQIKFPFKLNNKKHFTCEFMCLIYDCNADISLSNARVRQAITLFMIFVTTRRTVTQALSHRPLTAEDSVWSSSSHVGFVVDRVTLRQVSVPEFRFFPCQYHSTIAPYSFIHLHAALYQKDKQAKAGKLQKIVF